MTDFVTLAEYRERWWFHMPLAIQDGPSGPWGEILTGPEGTHGDDVEYLFSATAEDGPMIVAEHNAALEAGQAVARLREHLARICGAFMGGIYCTNCGESLDDCECIISEARAALSTPGGPESSGG